MSNTTTAPAASTLVTAEIDREQYMVTDGPSDVANNDHDSEAGLANGTIIDSNATTRELTDQLKATTERLNSLEAQVRAVSGVVGLHVDAIVDDSPVDNDAFDTDEETADDEAVPHEETRKKQPTIISENMKYVTSDDWLKGGLAKTYGIISAIPRSHKLSIVVSTETVKPAAADPNQAIPLETISNIVPKLIATRPDRLAITSATLLNEIGRISGTRMSVETNVFVRPFKNVVPFRQEFYESLQRNEEAYKTLRDLKKKRHAEYIESCKKAEQENEDPPSKEERRLTAEDQNKYFVAKKLHVGLTCLLHFIDHDAVDIMEFRRQVMDKEYGITFENLWHLFRPGQIVCPKGDKEQVYRVLQVGGGRPHRRNVDHDGQFLAESKTLKITDFFVDCFHIDFNGTHYVPAPITILISPYEGTRAIKNLAVRPISCMFTPEEEEKARRRLVERGQKFERLAAVSHQQYCGYSLPDQYTRCEVVDGDVIVDFALAFKNNPSSGVDVSGYFSHPRANFQPPGSVNIFDYITMQVEEETRETRAACSVPNCPSCQGVNYIFDDAAFEFARRSRFMDDNPALFKDVEKRLGDDRHMLLPYRMYGYVLLSRKWYPLDIDLLRDIKESQTESDGFKDLVLPEDHKQIVRALVKTHARGPRSATGKKARATREMDLVKGKGKGLIILLHGVPGVGKTSTAECVAAHTNRPLFPITCGDIGGQTPREVETNLESYFDLARKWGCVLLLDEADVFLGERTKGDILQNSLVSVFLRVLEYYSGVLILTTNRVGQFDEAIKSRIHISLYYPPLNRRRSLLIWEMNLKRLEREYGANSVQSKQSKSGRKSAVPPVRFDSREIMDFAKGHWKTCKNNKSIWNGRQIKNAFQTAIALAEWDAMDLQKKHGLKDPLAISLRDEHFRKVAEASAKFDQYLVSVRKDDSFNAKDKKNRLDDFKDRGTSSKYGMAYTSYEQTKKQRKSSGHMPVQVEDDDEDDSEVDSEEEKRAPVDTRRFFPEEGLGKEQLQLNTLSDDAGRKGKKSGSVRRVDKVISDDWGKLASTPDSDEDGSSDD